MQRNSYLRLLKNIVVTAILAGIVLFIYFKFFKSDGDDLDFLIDDTPLHIEAIKTISEIATVNYKDEVVVDTIEFYTEVKEKILGSLERMTDPDEIKYGLRMQQIKRRLTLIIKGNVNYGFELTKKNYEISHNKDTVWFNLPKPKILSLEMNPTQTEIFQESGSWSDNERKILQNRAIEKLKRNVELLNLKDKAEKNMIDLLSKLMGDKRKLVFYFDR